MEAKTLKKIRTIAAEVFKGYTQNSTGGCCGVSLPHEEQQELKRLKEGAQAKRHK